MKTVLFLPTQGPHLPREGPAEQFDWRVQCRLAAALQKGLPNAVVYVPSAFHQEGARPEIEYYGDQLRAEGISDQGLLLEARGFETIEQCELAVDLAEQEGARLVVISCHGHFKRVCYLLKGRAVEHVIAWGAPNRWLHFTHLVLTVAFPIIDVLRLRGWWKRTVVKRRLQGEQ
ncbi:MAG: hypothetical protein JWO89_735 [Verrucomicrobiaceae bacterium]|nr:hypothetical protein [Verrucomicrobiaceae bacterium]MDB6117427.1 hypothetical protein [Verrucomicrobiaceae bacterium]